MMPTIAGSIREVTMSRSYVFLLVFQVGSNAMNRFGIKGPGLAWLMLSCLLQRSFLASHKQQNKISPQQSMRAIVITLFVILRSLWWHAERINCNYDGKHVPEVMQMMP